MQARQWIALRLHSPLEVRPGAGAVTTIVPDSDARRSTKIILKMPEIACGEHDLPIRHSIYTDGRDWPDEIEPTFTLGSCNTPRTAGKTGKWCGFGRKANVSGSKAKPLLYLVPKDMSPT